MDVSGLPGGVKELVSKLLVERRIVVPEMQEEFDYMRVLPIHQPYDHASAIEATVAMLDRTEVPEGIREIVSKLVLGRDTAHGTNCARLRICRRPTRHEGDKGRKQRRLSRGLAECLECGAQNQYAENRGKKKEWLSAIP